MVHDLSITANTSELDPELQEALARSAVLGLDQLLTLLPAGETVDADKIGALVRLVRQALELGAIAG